VPPGGGCMLLKRHKDKMQQGTGWQLYLNSAQLLCLALLVTLIRLRCGLRGGGGGAVAGTFVPPPPRPPPPPAAPPPPGPWLP
jgi:hypothetical protein